MRKENLNSRPGEPWKQISVFSGNQKVYQPKVSKTGFNISRGYLTLQPPSYSIKFFSHFKLCFADAIHNFQVAENYPGFKTLYKPSQLRGSDVSFEILYVDI